MIRVSKYEKAYDGRVAVAGISFQVAPGQVLGLVGPNGAGKTTTLRALAGIISPSRGRLAVAGFDIERHPVQAKQRMAYVPDDPRLFDDLTVEQHLAFVAKIYGVASFERAAKQLLDEFDLTEQLHTRARDLSRGMRQKLAVCSAYLHDPQAILFDEPLTGLDPQGIRTLKRSIADRARHGAAVIVSSHLLAMVEDLCTHVMILQSGRQRFMGALSELKQQFADQAGETSLEDVFFQATGGVDSDATIVNAHAWQVS